MDSIQINIKTPTRGFVEIPFNRISLNNDNTLTVEVKEFNDALELYENQKLIFNRFVYTTSKRADIITGFSTIIKKSGMLLTISQPYFENLKVVKSYTANTIPNKVIVQLDSNHNIFLSDIGKQKLCFFDYEGNIIGETDDIGLILKREDILATSAKCIFDAYILDSCGDCNGEIEIREYIHTPEIFSRNSLVTSEIPDNTYYIGLKYNPFYYIDENNNCIFWEDYIWPIYENENNPCIQYINNGNNKVVLGYNDYTWNVGLGLDADLSGDKLGSEDDFNQSFIEDLSETLVPEVIDMERIKYSPAIIDGENMSIVTSITMNFHFRKRKEIKDYDISKNTSFTSGNVYYDSWDIDKENEASIWWNGFNHNDSTFDSGKMNIFYTQSGKTSDLIGYLNFTDKDVFYRKKKVSKSFVRLSFYTSNDPIEQKLIGFSTIFLDGGELYGKYIKQLSAINEGKIKAYDENENSKIVLTPKGVPVDTKMVITNEFDYKKSSEGFNIYLFKNDSIFNTNEEKTIYMKVEFNHAGNGKTIPMIMWPRDNDGNFVDLTINNFIESLYIPITLKYINGNYVYTIKGAEIDNSNIELILFEPKLNNLIDDLSRIINYSTTGSVIKNMKGTVHINNGDKILSKLPNTQQEGHEFEGWYWDGVKINDDTEMPDENINVVGNYKVIKYQVKVIKRNEDGTMKELYVNVFDYGTDYSTILSDEILINELTKLNTEFETYSLRLNGQDIDTTGILKSDIIIYVIMVGREYELFYFTEGLKRNGLKKLKYKDKFFSLLPNIQAPMYEFKGWRICNGENMGKPVEEGVNDIMPAYDLTVSGNFETVKLNLRIEIYDEKEGSEYFYFEVDYGAKLSNILKDEKLYLLIFRHWYEGKDMEYYLVKTNSEQRIDPNNFYIYDDGVKIKGKTIPRPFVISWTLIGLENANVNVTTSGQIILKSGDLLLPELQKVQPEVEGFDFVDWYLNGDVITDKTEVTNKDIEVVGKYGIETYTVIVIDEEEEIFNKTYDFGLYIKDVLNEQEIVDYVTNLNASGYDIEFVDNEDNIINQENLLLEDLTIYIKRIPQKFILTFINNTNEELPVIISEDEIDFGSNIIYPIMEDYEESGYTYTFKWDDLSYSGGTMPNHDVEIKGLYYTGDAILYWYATGLSEKYINNYKDYSGSTVLIKGEDYILSKLPSNADTHREGFTFSEWYIDNNLVKATDIMETSAATATGEYTINLYNINWRIEDDNGNIVSSGIIENVEYYYPIKGLLDDIEIPEELNKGTWYIETTGGLVAAEGTRMPDNDINIVNKATIITYKLEYQAYIGNDFSKTGYYNLVPGTLILGVLPSKEEMETSAESKLPGSICNFLGWSLDIDGYRVITDTTEMPNKDLPVYGRYEVTYDTGYTCVIENNLSFAIKQYDDRGDYMYIDEVPTIAIYQGEELLTKIAPDTSEECVFQDSDELIWASLINSSGGTIDPEYQYIFRSGFRDFEEGKGQKYLVCAYNGEKGGNNTRAKYHFDDFIGDDKYGVIDKWVIEEVKMSDINEININTDRINKGYNIYFLNSIGEAVSGFTSTQNSVDGLFIKDIKGELVEQSMVVSLPATSSLDESQPAFVYWYNQSFDITGNTLVLRQTLFSLERNYITNINKLVNWVPTINHIYGDNNLDSRDNKVNNFYISNTLPPEYGNSYVEWELIGESDNIILRNGFILDIKNGDSILTKLNEQVVIPETASYELQAWYIQKTDGTRELITEDIKFSDINIKVVGLCKYKTSEISGYTFINNLTHKVKHYNNNGVETGEEKIPTIILYKGDKVLGTIKSGEKLVLPNLNEGEGKIWTSIVNWSGYVPEYQYVYETGVFDSENNRKGSRYLSCIKNGELSNIENVGYDFNTLTSGDTFSSWTIRELKLNEMSSVTFTVNGSISFYDENDNLIKKLNSKGNLDGNGNFLFNEDGIKIKTDSGNYAFVYWLTLSLSSNTVYRQTLDSLNKINNVDNLVNWIPANNTIYYNGINARINLNVSDTQPTILNPLDEN